MLFSTVLLSLFLTLALVPVLRRHAAVLRAIDLPNERKVHTLPIPKIGGLAMTIGFLVPVLVWSRDSGLVMPLVCSALVVALFGFLDDLLDLGYRWKFAAQLAAALVIVQWADVRILSLGDLLPEGQLLPAILAVPLTLVTIIGVTNAVNLADGLDGLAGGVSFLTFLALALLAYQADRPDVALVAAAVCGAIFGFLRFNTHPASVFMGDCGSQLLGFLAIVLSLVLSQSTPFSPLLPLLLLGLPVFDTVRVMTERMRKGAPPFKADRNHFHHKLLDMGFVHAEAVVIIYLLQGVLIASGILFRFHSDWLLLLGYALFALLVLAGLKLASTVSLLKSWRLPLQRLLARRRRLGLQSESLAAPSAKALQLVLLLVGGAMVLLPSSAPAPLSWSAQLASLVILIASRAGLQIRGWIMRLAVYLLSPFFIYFSQLHVGAVGSPALTAMLDGGYLLLGLAVLLTLRFAGKGSYQATPLDALIMLLVVLVPLMPVMNIDRQFLFIVVAKIVTFFFAFEYLVVEHRRRLLPLEIASAGLLGLGGMHLLI